MSTSSSPSDQQADGSSIERQQATIEAYVKRNNLELVETLIDEGLSAYKRAHLESGKLGQFLSDVDKDRYKGFALVIEEMDRLSGLGIDETHDILRRLLRGRVETHLALENWIVRDLDDLTTVILNAVKSFAAKDYSAKLSERIRKGWANKKANAATGVVTANVPAWLKVEAGKIVEIPEKAAAVREAFRLPALGLGTKKIQSKLNLTGRGFSLSWLSRTLRNRAVLGESVDATKYFPPIVTQTEWDAARAEIDRKNKIPGSKRYRGGDRCSDQAKNLFGGLMKDVTSEPIRGMAFQTVHGISYLYSTFCPKGRKAGRLKYTPFERAFLDFLDDLDWKSVVGQSENDEVKVAQVKLDGVLSDLDKTSRRIVANEKLLEDPDHPARDTILRLISKDEAEVTKLEAERDALRLTVDAAKRKSEALYDVGTLRVFIKSGDNDTRLRLRSEIRKRIARIEFIFGAKFEGNTDLVGDGWTVVRIRFVNGVERLIVLKDKGYILLWAGEKKLVNTNDNQPALEGMATKPTKSRKPAKKSAIEIQSATPADPTMDLLARFKSLHEIHPITFRPTQKDFRRYNAVLQASSLATVDMSVFSKMLSGRSEIIL